MPDVVVPAHNEADTIAAVLFAIRGAPSVESIIVVADACTDATAEVAIKYADVVLTTDAGDKGTAMALGLTQVATDDVVFIDADLHGLAWQHVEALCTYPPAGGMLSGLRDEVLSFGERLGPPITGERRLPAAFARSVHFAGQGYRAEILLDAAVGSARLPHRTIVLVGVTNPTRAATDPLGWLKMWADLALLCIGLAPELVRYLMAPGS